MRRDVENVNFSGFGKSCDMVRIGRSRRTVGERIGEDSSADSVDATFVRNSSER